MKPDDLLLLVVDPWPGEEVQVAGSMADLASAMDGARLVSLSFQQRRRRRMEGEERGMKCARRSPDL